MDEKLKYRLVGASVILALAVFFLPMILDSEKYRSQIQSQIPEIPSENQAEQSESLEQKNQTPPFQASGPVEKGPLVINLDDDAEPAQQAAPEKTTIPEPQESIAVQETGGQLSSSQPASSQSSEQDISKKEEPAVASKPIEQQERQQVTQTETPAKTAKPELKAKPQPKESTESELAFSDSAWLIQIGSFSGKGNATKLVNSLREQGYRAYQRVGDSYARVYVGPYPVKGEAEQRTGDLEKIVGSKVKVIEFDPKQH